MSRLSRAFSKLWSAQPVLVALVAFSSLCLLVSLSGVIFDSRLIGGEHAWIKPLKFSISLTTYGITLIWFSVFITSHKVFFRRICLSSFVGTVVELSAIIMQAARGTTSHFNTATAFDHAVFWLIAAAIMPVAFGTLAVFIMLIREKDLPPVLGVSLRWAAILTVIGFIPGLLMLLPEATQDFITHAKQFDGPGLPLIGWSTVGGDLRVAHFVGIHALQVMPIIGYLIMKSCYKLSVLRQELLVAIFGIMYFGVIALLTSQALSAESVAAPSAHTLACFVLIAVFGLASSSGIFIAPAMLQKFQSVLRHRLKC